MRKLERKKFLCLSALGIGALTLGFTPKERYVLWGDGIHDDTEAFQAWADDKEVFWASGGRVEDLLVGKTFMMSDTIYLRNTPSVKTCCYCRFEYPKNRNYTCFNYESPAVGNLYFEDE